MTYIVTERCVDSRYTECVADCPVDCFYEIADPHMLIINPDECIDCDACVPLCPINAIYPEDELPEEYEEWADVNSAENCEGLEPITEMQEALQGALDLDQIYEREEEQFGAAVEDPSNA